MSPQVPTPSDDHTLVTRLRAGDERAFREVWDRYHALLADFSYRYVRSRDVAMDVVQHVFFTLWQSRETLEPRHSLASYLFAAARNRAWNLQKHERIAQAHVLRTSAEPRAVSLNDGEAMVATEELQMRVRAIVDTLTPRVREIYLMSREDALAPADIAAIVGVSQQVVYNQLARALKAIAEGLRGE